MIDPAAVDSNLFTYIKSDACDFWTINPYIRCDHNCNYCITRVQGKSVPSFDTQETLRLVAQALDHIPAHLTLSIGGISDGYPSSEVEFKQTRAILELLNSRNRSYSIITKGTAVERDIDVIARNPRARVVFSFSSLDEELSRKYELNAPSPLVRIGILKKMAARGISTAVSLMPWIPGVTNIQAFLDEVPDDIQIQIERLKIVRGSRKFAIEGQTLSQQEIDDLYLQEREKYSDSDRLRWEMDQAYSSEAATGVHPTIAGIRQSKVECSRLFDRGLLLEEPTTDVIYRKG